MSIRLIAIELYQCHREVEKVAEQLRNAPPDKRNALKDQLRKLTAERDRMRSMLDGQKG